MRGKIKYEEKILILTNESEVIQIARNFFNNHPNIDVRWDSLNKIRKFKDGEFSLIVIGAEHIDKSFDLVFSNVESIRQVDKNVGIIIVANDDDIIMDSRIMQHVVDDLIILPFRAGAFGFRILGNLSRYRKHRVLLDTTIETRSRYEKGIKDINDMITSFMGG